MATAWELGGLGIFGGRGLLPGGKESMLCESPGGRFVRFDLMVGVCPEMSDLPRYVL